MGKRKSWNDSLAKLALVGFFIVLLPTTSAANVDAPDQTCESKHCKAADFEVPAGQTGSIKYTCANAKHPYGLVTCNFKNHNGASCTSHPQEQNLSTYTCSCKNAEPTARRMQSYMVCYALDKK